MNVLGLFGFGMNPGACLLQDGRLVAFCEEERFTRFKTSEDLFPGHAAAFVLREGELELGEVDRIAFGWDATRYPYGMLKTLARQFLRYRRRAPRRREGGGNRSSVLAGFSNVLKYAPDRIEEGIRFGLRSQGLRGPVPPIEFVPHHLSHSYSTYYCSPFEEAVVLTLDGSGEEVSTQIAIGRGEELEVVESIPVPHSLGWYYGAFTSYFGFQPYRHEGKLMALAGLGARRAAHNPWPERLSRVLPIAAGSYEVDPLFTRFGNHTHSERFTDHLADFLAGHDPRLQPIVGHGPPGGHAPYLDEAYVDLAWGVQERLEEAVLAIARRVAGERGLRNLCVAGGVGLNCKMNGRLLRDPAFDAVFVQPASYDAGSSIGAAMVVARREGDPVRNVLENAYLGPSYSNDEIRRELEACGLRGQECDDVAARVAQELAAGRTIGWFQGRSEAGPRALGARSILAHPGLPGISEHINRGVKSREIWRPFCPSILEEYRHEYFEDSHEAPFMTTAFQVREERRGELRAVVHQDGSARPQTVSRAASPLYHRLLTEFHGRTGLPFVLNTSFNVDGEPIVRSPRDAIRCFYSSGLDVLAMGDFVLSKV